MDFSTYKVVKMYTITIIMTFFSITIIIICIEIGFPGTLCSQFNTNNQTQFNKTNLFYQLIQSNTIYKINKPFINSLIF